MNKKFWDALMQKLSRMAAKNPRQYRLFAWILGVALSLVALYLLYSISFLGRIYPNVYLGQQSFAGLTIEQAKAKLEILEQDRPAQPITLIYRETSAEISPDEIGWQIDKDKTVSAMYALGRSGGFFSSLAEQLGTLVKKKRLIAKATYDLELLEARIAEVAEVVDQRAIDASAQFVLNRLVVTREQVGKRVNQELIARQLTDRWGSFTAGEIVIELEFEAPKIVLGDEAELEATVEKLSKYQLTLISPREKKSLKPDEIRQLIGFVGKDPLLGVDNPVSQQILTAEFTLQAVMNFLGQYAQTIDQPARDPKLEIRSGQLVIAEKSKEGTVVDITVSAELILGALHQEPEPREVALVMKTALPVISENNLSELGIVERIGYGETNFTGSPANRRHNIANGTSILQSALIKPGEEFSTVKALGAVDNTTGFLPELVIKENRTVPEFGGGLCQVSTTLFRSVLNAGLKVTERRNHSYRVSYYEPPVGLDATIYLPKPDFRFLNDTPGHILVQGRVIGNKVVFELWGTSDGRTTHLTEPIVSNITPPGEPIYVETDTLPKGEQKQIEKPHEGATAVVTYTVSRNGQVINKQTFRSVYKAWPARFLVGTNESLPPTTQDPA